MIDEKSGKTEKLDTFIKNGGSLEKLPFLYTNFILPTLLTFIHYKFEKQAMYLVDKGLVDPNKRFSKRGALATYPHSPLTYATTAELIGLVKSLIRARADINKNLTVGVGNPLSVALSKNNLELMDILMKAGPNKKTLKDAQNTSK